MRFCGLKPPDIDALTLDEVQVFVEAAARAAEAEARADAQARANRPS